MKQIILSIIITSFVLQLSAQKYQIDIKNSTLSWVGYGELGGFTQQGSIALKEGRLSLNNANIKSAELVADMKSIKSGNKDLTRHLKQADFFDVKKFPEASLKMISLHEGILLSSLTIRGITKEIEIPIRVYYKGDEVSVQGKVSIDRTNFDIKYNSSSYFQDLGNYAIKNKFDLEFDLSFVVR